MATLIERYINTDSTPGGTGISNTTTGTDRAYASLAEWESSEQKDLVTADEYHHVSCTGTGVADTTVCSITGWTTDATHNITIENNDDPLGKFDNSIYFMDMTNTHGISISEDYTVLRKMQVRMNYGELQSITQFCYNYSDANIKGIILDRCIGLPGIINATSTANLRAIQCVTQNTTVGEECIIVNCLFYDMDIGNGSANTGIYANVPSSVHVYFTTVVDCGDDGIKLGGNGVIFPTVKNCISVGNTDDDYGLGTGNIKLNCLSSDLTGSTGLTNKNPTFVDSANGDFHLVEGSDGSSVGTDLSSDTVYAVSTDVDSDTRSSTPTVGFDEYIEELIESGLGRIRDNFKKLRIVLLEQHKKL